MLKKVFTSKSLLVIIVLFTALCTFINGRWKTGSIIRDDVIFYYCYLPATFIYHDLTFRFVSDQKNEIQAKIYTPTTKDNRVVQKMTMGVALLLLPFFYIAHLYSILNFLPTNGYTPVYEFSIAFAALFYFTIGLIFLRKTLKAFFNERTVALTLLVIALCTNLFYYTSYESGMSHVYNFGLFSIFLWLTVKWHAKPSFLNSFLTGLILGTITLIRPTNCIVALFFILYSIIDKNSFLQKIRLIKEKWPLTLIIVVAVFIPISLQLIYWKYTSGHWVYYSYGNQRFFFNNPHILEGLFGFRKGFFIYAPAMLMIIPGLWLAFRERKIFAWSAIIFSIVNVYVIFSWWSWWYGGSFGARPMIDSFAVSALPLGVFIKKCTTGKLIKKIILIIFILFFSLLNLFQTEQAKSTLLHYDSMNANLYFKIFGKLIFPDNYVLMLTRPDTENALKGLPEREVFDLSADGLKLLYTYKVNIKGSNQKFVCADADRNGRVVCNRDQPFSWEEFLLRRYVGDFCTLQSSKEKYVGITSETDSILMAYQASPGKFEIFKIVDLGNNKFALKSFNGSYVTIDKVEPGQLINSVPGIGETGTFELIVVCDSSHKNNNNIN
ncbi:MAG TPA: hypothetical protein VJY62_09635 [Bacteroidia bacterium]|nr:hypothetical protein [Bacteroidia bacterium]